jgi:hypothetical protein
MMQQSAPRMLSDLQSAGPRRFLLNAGGVFGSDVQTTTVELTLPEGWRVRLPESVDVQNSFGRYRVSYTQEGRVFRIVRETAGARGTLPVDKLDELKAMMQAIASDDARFFLVDKGTAHD